MHPAFNHPRRWTRALFALAALLVFLTSSCKLLSSAANAPGKVASGFMGGSKSTEKIPPNLLQAGVMRFADTFSSRITQATQDFAEKAGTPQARVQGMTWAIGQSTSAFTIASGPNPNVAVLDLVVLVTLGRMVHEEYWMPMVWGEADRPMVEAFTEMEKEAWLVAGQMFSPALLDIVRSALTKWREENPDVRLTAFVRLPAFRDIAKLHGGSGKDRGNPLGDLLSVDPLAGLEPAVREIEQTRLFGERTMFYLQRAPILMSTQVELLGLKLMLMPEVHSALEDSERITQAAMSIAETAAKLPESVRMEREAAVKQIADELTLQRQGMVADLERAQGPAGKVLSDARATLEAGTQMSAALQGTIGTLDAFLAGFKEEAPPPGEPPPPPSEPGKPFDITEYGEAAQGIEAAARELNGLVTSLDQSLPQVQRAVDQAVESSDRAVDHAFVRGLELGSILIGVAAIAVLAVRWISARLFASKTPQAG